MNLSGNTKSLSWQARKSRESQLAILNAALTQVYDHGFASLTFKTISEAAEISRGAVLHHFRTKRDLLRGLVQFLFDQRISEFRSQILSLTPEQRERQEAFDAYHQLVQSRHYTVYLELLMAARTDSDLRLVLTSEHEAFIKRWRADVREIFPEWRARNDDFFFASLLIQYGLDGYMLNRFAAPKNEDGEVFIAGVKKILRDMRGS